MFMFNPNTPQGRLLPFGMCRGNRSARLAIVGEAPGNNEDALGRPFVGASGHLLKQLLGLADLDLDKDTFCTNVFNERPENNDIESFCLSTPEARKVAGGTDLPQFGRGKWLDPRMGHHVERLHRELERVRPSVILGLGNTALWALTGRFGIGAFRGVFSKLERVGRLPATFDAKVLCTFHPAAVMREWGQFPVAASDVRKAVRGLDVPGLGATRRRLLVNPTVEEVEAYARGAVLDTSPLAVDVETAGEQITTIGFGTPTEAISVPLYNPGSPMPDVWSRDDEVRVLSAVQSILLSVRPKVLQNGMYDVQRIYWSLRMRVRNPALDTMLMHHAMQPELKKSLGFLASLHLDEPAWKHMREDTKKLMDQEKKDD